MIIQIDDKTRLSVTSEYFAPMKIKKRKGVDTWEEYRWFTSLEHCIKFLTQKKLAEKKVVIQLKEFLTEYRKTATEIKEILQGYELV